MRPYYDHGGITIYHGDCREVLPTLAAESVDIVWTDPPYGHNNNNAVKIHRWEDPLPTMAPKKCAPSSMRLSVSVPES